MRNNKIPIRQYLAIGSLVFIVGLIVATCKKPGIAIPPSQSTFLNQTSGTYFITAPGVADTIPIGVTAVTNADRTLSFSVTSPSGAAAGTQYTISPANTVTIPANQAIGYIIVQGNYNAYVGTPRKDTLVFAFTDDKSTGVTPSAFNDSFTLVMSGPCFEGNVDLNALAGAYNNTIDDGSSPPYTTMVIAGATSGTTGQITIANFYNAGLNNLVFSLDWTDPANRTLTFVPQYTGQSAGILNSAYSAYPLWIYTTGTPGTFSACSMTFTVNYAMGIPNLGTFPNEQTILSR